MKLFQLPALVLFSFFLLLAPNTGSHITNGINHIHIPKKDFFTSYSENLYSDLDMQQLDFEVFQIALKGYFSLRQDSILKNQKILSIVDFQKSSNEKRLFVIDLEGRNILFHSLVAHGKNTGLLEARKFSNTPRSSKSSLGFFVTNETYIGRNGLSLRLDGQEKAINDNARRRAVVIHGAKYVSEDFIRRRGRLGRSFGCPALSLQESKAIIETIKDKSCFFIYYPDSSYLNKSSYINKKVTNTPFSHSNIRVNS